ncbi:ABC transporter ATP-binding protein, partial [Pirellulaceae bacterium]|nr:ABC transporter ATP-binding protein [Pirellulaceae bacterium]
PYFILADEATGNLDSVTTDEILQLFERLNNEGRTIIMVTHEDEVSAHAKRVIRLRDGLIQTDIQNTDRVTNLKKEAMAKIQDPAKPQMERKV